MPALRLHSTHWNQTRTPCHRAAQWLFGAVLVCSSLLNLSLHKNSGSEGQFCNSMQAFERNTLLKYQDFSALSKFSTLNNYNKVSFARLFIVYSSRAFISHWRVQWAWHNNKATQCQKLPGAISRLRNTFLNRAFTLRNTPKTYNSAMYAASRHRACLIRRTGVQERAESSLRQTNDSPIPYL